MIYNEGKYNYHWETKKLAELGEFSRGVSKHRPRNDERLFEGGGYPLVQTGDVKDADLYITKHTQEYGEFGLKQSKLWKENTLCITIAANIAETALLSYPMCFPDSVVGFNADPDMTTEEFMYYIFEYIRTSIQNSASGSIQDNINIDYLTSLEFKIPKKNYQDKIVSLLSDIDKKIINNRKINDNLHQQICELYNYWFIQYNFPDITGKLYRESGGKLEYDESLKREKPVGWKVSILSRECITKLGGTPDTTKKEYWHGDIPWLSSGEVAINPIVFAEKTITDQGLQESSTSFSKAGTVLLSITRYIRPSVLGIDACYNQSVVAVEESEKFKTGFLYPFLMSMVDTYMTVRTGAQQPHINKATVDDTAILVPPDEVLLNYYRFSKPIIENQIRVAKESQTLLKIRADLLPLLMNGQATISD